MDQRTRERLPVLPALIAAVERPAPGHRRAPAAAQAAAPGSGCSPPAGQTLRRPVMTTAARRGQRLGRGPRTAASAATSPSKSTARSGPGPRWKFCGITGIRIEELTELSHHSLVQYRLPATGELIPLLQIAPSKTDTERLLPID